MLEVVEISSCMSFPKNERSKYLFSFLLLLLGDRTLCSMKFYLFGGFTLQKEFSIFV